jgi:hypothetical protein
MRHEVSISHAAHWKIYDLQTEEENPEGQDAVPVTLEAVRDVLFANTYMYRVSRTVLPKPYAVMAKEAEGVAFANVKVFSQTRLAFDNSVFDEGSGVEVRAHHFVSFELTKALRKGAPLPLPAGFAPGAKLTEAATGFSNASGLTADGAGTVYFSDAARHVVYRLDPEQKKATVLARTEQSPTVLGFVAPATLLAINSEKSVSAVDVRSGAFSTVNGTPEARPGTTLLLPVGLHNELNQLEWLLGHVGYTYRMGSNTAARSGLEPQERGFYYAPGSTTAVMAGGTWRPLLQSSQLAPFRIGERRLVVSEDDATTWWGTLRSFEAGVKEPLATALFAERGGTSVAQDAAGNVYLADGQVYVYDRDGKPEGVLEIPERPQSLCFGGMDGKTLFIGARGSVFAIETAAGR